MEISSDPLASATTSGARASFLGLDTTIAAMAVPRISPHAVLLDTNILVYAYNADSEYYIDVHENVINLMRQLGFGSKHIYDVVLAATMLGNGVAQLYTYDIERFQKIPGIKVLKP